MAKMDSLCFCQNELEKCEIIETKLKNENKNDKKKLFSFKRQVKIDEHLRIFILKLDHLFGFIFQN
jgi:hypothetical protein